MADGPAGGHLDAVVSESESLAARRGVDIGAALAVGEQESGDAATTEAASREGITGAGSEVVKMPKKEKGEGEGEGKSEVKGERKDGKSRRRRSRKRRRIIRNNCQKARHGQEACGQSKKAALRTRGSKAKRTPTKKSTQ